jgi:replicative superfamily II helicase
MRNFAVDSLKDSHPQYNSGVQYTTENLKLAIDRLYKSREMSAKMKQGEMENMMLQSSKKKQESQSDAVLDKYMALSKDESCRGNLLYRYLNLEEVTMNYDMKEKKMEDIKEITRLGKLLNITFGKKSPSEAYFAIFYKIFNAYISMPEAITVESFQPVMKHHLPEFDIKLNEEILDRIRSVFEYVFQNSLLILTSPVYEEAGGQEYKNGLSFAFANIADCAQPVYDIEEEDLDLDMEFDDLELENEYIGKEEFDGITILTRGAKKNIEIDTREQTVGKLATAEDVARLDKIENLKVLENEKNLQNLAKLDEAAEIHALDRDVKADTPFREFYNQFKNILCKNEYWQTSLFNCLDMLSDMGKPNDLLFDQVIGYFDGEIEPSIYLLDKRTEIVADFLRTKRDMDKKRSKKAGKRIISNVTQRNAEEDFLGATNHEVLAMLGMSEKDIKAEEKLGLKSKHLRYEQEIDKRLEETYGNREENLVDFVNLHGEALNKVMGANFTKADFPEYIVFDCKPEPKAELTGPLFKISDFPYHISEVFKDIQHLNQLQTQVKEIAFDTDENMLVCAPTGAGKTNVALLAILREFDKSFDHKTKRAGEFKIVYISPLKALATEIVEKFSSKLGPAGVIVKEFTGDMSLTKQELLETHIIVSTPEKWDVMTRKSDNITELVKMIIIDEIHLLDEERGRVLECIVARTTITIERKQQNIRLVGLSATLPNYIEVANFMQVKKGLFYFNETYRPVPLYKKFIGVRNPREMSKPNADGGKKNKKNRGPDQNEIMYRILYDMIKDNLARREQVLIFVHSRKDTVKTPLRLLEMAAADGDNHLFVKPQTSIKENLLVNKDLKTLVSRGLGSHNAGLCRKDRRIIETGFLDGTLRVVCCTATLAWGVNLPAHTVIIKGTDVYEPGVGFKDLSILDVQQIFGRAGRPQFDSYGEAVLITKIERINHFIGNMTAKISIKSQFEGILLEALNAEISLGNITTLSEAFEYIKRTFYYVRAKKNPRSVGADKADQVEEIIQNLIEDRLNYLNDLKFIRYDRSNLILESTELGRICSHFYVNCSTMEKFCKYLNFYEDLNLVAGPDQNKHSVDAQCDIEDQDLLAILAQASEFEQLQTRQEEIEELDKIKKRAEFLEPVHPEFKKLLGSMQKKMEKKEFETFKEEMTGDHGNKEERQMNSYEKVMLLIQGYLSMESYDNYSLVADTHYIVQNGTRILRCIYDICLKKNIAFLAMTVLKMCRYIENNVRDDLSPLRMFCFENVKRGILSIRRGQDIKDNKFFLEDMTCKKIEKKLYGENANYSLYSSIKALRNEQDIGYNLKLNHGEAYKLKKLLMCYPLIDVEYQIRPIAQTILKVDLKVFPDFIYSKQFHLTKEHFELIVEYKGEILHHESFGIITKNLIKEKGAPPVEFSFFVPFKEKAECYMIYIMSDRFVGADTEIELDLKDVMIHTEKMEYTDLLDLQPLKIATLNNPAFERLYKMKYFNPIQTQLFHALYYTDHNVLVGAPTGSGKTIMAELAMLRAFANNPKQKIIYVGPYKALVKERLNDWKKRFETPEMNKKVVELTGDYTPDLEALISANVLVTTPEKWDGISRNWQNRNYVTNAGLIIFDEIHLLGQDRGPVIEVIVSRMNYISSKTGMKIRMIGLSTAMASGADVANWFGVPKYYMFNFRPNVRPVPVEIHFKGFSDKNYCPRMNSMNKPAFNDIKKFSANSPVLVNLFYKDLCFFKKTNQTDCSRFNYSCNERSVWPLIVFENERR